MNKKYIFLISGTKIQILEKVIESLLENFIFDKSDIKILNIFVNNNQIEEFNYNYYCNKFHLLQRFLFIFI